MRDLYNFQDWSVCFAAAKYADRSWEYIIRSQTHECMNWDWGRTIPFVGIHELDFLYSVRLLFLFLKIGWFSTKSISFFFFSTSSWTSGDFLPKNSFFLLRLTLFLYHGWFSTQYILPFSILHTVLYNAHILFQAAERKAWAGKKEDMGREWTQRQSTSDPENGVLTFEQGSNCPTSGNDQGWAKLVWNLTFSKRKALVF